MMTSYLLVVVFVKNALQVLEYRWNNCAEYKGDYTKNESHLVTFHVSILISLWTFQPTLVVLGNKKN